MGRKGWFGLLLMLAAWPSGALAASLFEEVAISSEGPRTVVRIVFPGPMRYQSHAPATRGRELRIVLRPLSPDDFPAAALYGRETRGWDAAEPHPLRSLRHEGSRTSGSVLTLEFARSVRFRIRSAPDLRTLLVTLERPVPRRAPAASPSSVGGEMSSAGAAERAASPSPAARADARPPARGRYVLYLASDTRPIDPSGVRLPEALRGLRPFVTEADVRGRRWYRLTLGPFDTRQAVKAAREQLRARYPSAWIGLARQALPRTAATPATAADGRIGRMLRAGRDAMTEGQHRRAARIFAAVLEQPALDEAARREALELLGLARERLGQLARARDVYRRYLQRYPEGPDADRVRQRLAGVLTAVPDERERKRLAEGTERQRTRPRVRQEFYGSLSQEYIRDHTVNADDPAAVGVQTSRLSTSLDLNARRRGPEMELRMRASLQHQHDFTGQVPDARSVGDLYFEARHRPGGLRARIGRQRQGSSGVNGRFDGLLLSGPLGEAVELRAVGGFPVDLNDKDTVRTRTRFVGLSADIAPIDSAWSYNLFFIEQRRDGLSDRRAIGGEIRHFADDRSLFAQFDYDLSYGALNLAMVQYNLDLSDRDSVYATVDHRFAPSLTTGNALIGQTVTTLEALRALFSESRIRALARDRTPRVTSVTLGGTHRFSDALQVNGDLGATRTGATPASGGVAATPATGIEWFWSLQLVGNDLFARGETLIVGARLGDTDTARTLSVNFDVRRRLGGAWRLNPRLFAEYRQPRDAAGVERHLLKPSLRAEYRPRPDLEFTFEIGGDWSREDDPVNGVRDRLEYFLLLGYRWDF